MQTNPTEQTTSVVAGRNAVLELLKSGRDIDKIFVKKGEREGSIRVIVAQAHAAGVPVVEVEKNKLDAMAAGAVHQGVVAQAAEKEYVSVKDILQLAADRGEDPFLVICDGITDPHNLGAIIRSAEAAGCHGLILPKRRSVGLTSVVGKASAGALAHLAVARVSNLATTVRELKKAGVWVYTADMGGSPYRTADTTGPAAFILGSEGEGVSHLLRELADVTLAIPMYGNVSSLNVSAAAAVLLFDAAAKRHPNA